MSGSELIAAERARQQTAEGFDARHDAQHDRGELLRASLCYLATVQAPEHYADGHVSRAWPWDARWWKYKADPLVMLAKAGALIAAEIDRRLAAAAPSEGHPDGCGCCNE